MLQGRVGMPEWNHFVLLLLEWERDVGVMELMKDITLSTEYVLYLPLEELRY